MKINKIVKFGLVVFFSYGSGLIAQELYQFEPPDPYANRACFGQPDGNVFVPIATSTWACEETIDFNVYQCAGGGGRYLTTVAFTVSRPCA